MTGSTTRVDASDISLTSLKDASRCSGKYWRAVGTCQRAAAQERRHERMLATSQAAPIALSPLERAFAGGTDTIRQARLHNTYMDSPSGSSTRISMMFDCS